jgi:hypothetical protein
MVARVKRRTVEEWKHRRIEKFTCSTVEKKLEGEMKS